MTDPDHNDTVHIGAFEPPEAKQVLDELESAGIPFEIERDDSSIRKLTPFRASIGGTFGHGALILIRVPKTAEEAAREIVSRLFPEQT